MVAPIKTSYKYERRIIPDKNALFIFLIFLGISLSLPRIVSNFWIYNLSLVFAYSIGVIGQGILMMSGQISFGQSAFLAIGAYTFAHIINAIGIAIPLSVAIPLISSGIIGGIVGAMVGIPSLRLKGPYLAIATLGLSITTYQILQNFEIISGGRMGLKVKRIFFKSPEEIYYFTFSIFIVMVFLAYRISKDVGKIFLAILSSDVATASLGVNPHKYKVFAFVISSFFTGISGGLYAYIVGHLDPIMFTVTESIYMFSATIIGGVPSVAGGIMGASFVYMIPNIFSGLKEFFPILLGIAVILAVIFDPLGLYGRWLKIKNYFLFFPFR